MLGKIDSQLQELKAQQEKEKVLNDRYSHSQ